MLARIVRGTIFGLVALALVAGRPGLASANHDRQPLDDLVFDIADDVFDTWNAFYYLDDLTTSVYTGSVETACGQFGDGDRGNYCAREATAYFNLDGLAEVRADYGDAGVALLVADAIGYHVLASIGAVSRGEDRDVQATCLAGFWARDAVLDGNLTHADVVDAIDWYKQLYADAFEIGYETVKASDCFDVVVI